MKKYILLFLFSICISSLCAQRSKLKDLEDQRKLALLEIENTNKLLEDTKVNTSSLLNRIQLIATQITARQMVLRLLEQEIESMGVEEKGIEEEVTILEGELSVKKDAYNKAVMSVMRNRQNDNKLLFVLSGRSLTEAYRRFSYLKDYSDWRKRQADEIIGRNEQLALKHDSLQITKKEKELLLTNRTNEQTKLKEEEENYQGEISKAQEKEKELQQILDQKRRQAQALDKQIEKLIAEEVDRQEKKAQREQEEAKRKEKEEKAKKEEHLAEKPAIEKPKTATDAPKPKLAEAISTKANIVLSGSFEANKGKLPYPISGTYTITSRFGETKRSRFVTTSSGGIDIQSQSNAVAKAVFRGEVTSIVSIPGYGNCILVRHGNYYTFYGNIQNIAIKKGDTVNTGQTLGTIYTDPDTNISQIHFQLWQKKTKLNPTLWLRQ